MTTDSPHRGWIQGLARIADGFQRWDENALARAERQLLRGLHLVHDAPAEVHGVNVEAVRDAADRLVTAVRRGDPADARMVANRPTA